MLKLKEEKNNDMLLEEIEDPLELDIIENLPKPNSLNSSQIVKDVISFSLPFIVFELSNLGKTFIRTIMLGKKQGLGASAIAASNLADASINLISAPLLVMYAQNSLINQQKGDEDELRKTFRQAIFLDLLMGALTTGMLFGAKPLLNFFQHNKEIVNYAQRYCNVYSAAVIPTAIYNTEVAFIAATGKEKSIILIELLGLAAFSGTSYFFIFHTGLGMEGAALGFVAQQAVKTCVMTAYLLKGKAFEKYDLLSKITKLDINIKEYLKYGWSFWFLLLEIAPLFIIKNLMGRFSQAGLVIDEVGIQWLGISDLLTAAVSSSISMRIAQNVKEKNLSNISKYGTVNYITNFAATALVSAPLILAPKAIASIFLNNVDSLGDTGYLMLAFGLMAAYKIGIKMEITGGSNLIGVLDTAFPNITRVGATLAIALPLAYVLGFPLDLKFIGIYLALATSAVTGATVNAVRWMQQKKLPEKKPWNPNRFFKDCCVKKEEPSIEMYSHLEENASSVPQEKTGYFSKCIIS